MLNINMPLGFINRLPASDVNQTETAAIIAICLTLEAIKNHKPSESLKSSICKNSPYQGFQQKILSDEYPNSPSPAFFVVMNKEKFKSAL